MYYVNLNPEVSNIQGLFNKYQENVIMANLYTITF